MEEGSGKMTVSLVSESQRWRLRCQVTAPLSKIRGKLEEETLAMTKSVKRPKKKSAQMVSATKTAAFHSTTMKKARRVKKTILKTRLSTLTRSTREADEKR